MCYTHVSYSQDLVSYSQGLVSNSQGLVCNSQDRLVCNSQDLVSYTQDLVSYSHVCYSHVCNTHYCEPNFSLYCIMNEFIVYFMSFFILNFLMTRASVRIINRNARTKMKKSQFQDISCIEEIGHYATFFSCRCDNNLR